MVRELAVHLQNRKGRRVDIKASTLYGIALMSLYRRGLPIWAENDVRVLNREHSRAPTSGSAAEAVPRPQAADAPLDWTPRRRSQPADILLPMTRRWIESLPHPSRPDALAGAYPRIANRIAAAWRDPVECRAVFDDLLIDRRGGRRGFPAPVLGDLLALRALFDGGHGPRG